MQDWREIIKQALEKPLPGLVAHEFMAPSVRFTGTKEPDRKVARLSSVLILLYPSSKGLSIPFIQRPEYVGVHGGQISLPGGKCEPTDACYYDTALRETHEELGIDPDTVTLLGELSSLYIPNSNYIVYPQVGSLDGEPEFRPNQFEVKEVFDVPLNVFLEPVNRTLIKNINGHRLEAPFFDVEGRQIWGATAMIMSEFAVALKKYASDWVSEVRSCNARTAQESP
ncbi:NUDIX hydrolase [Alkalitalea saponilacus]|uniref:8-oxo-dGTP pyrophosphatase MutT, NUDIX family n=1 Tax=Alkalitalea saponilacus TaxID=889453 RepID=A0A1T5HT27_9BACT|nr:CoA pyrophosphatase [Alkalitalea saponilacus]ASB51053.1 coenzyme A pyrophosphatase [Alkalitalea saponilacus]SKC23834.1 8-oxo-dGTP pyrophosphatase MutT, NUDIX family [Alkalitalea saponilacus]